MNLRNSRFLPNPSLSIGAAGAIVFAAATLLSGCASLFGNPRGDFRDPTEPVSDRGTTAGRFTEGNWIRETEADTPMGHLENPSSRLGSQRGKFVEGERPGLTDSSGDSGVSLASSEDYNRDPALAQAQRLGKKRRMTKEDFLDDSKGDGSLWTSDGQTNYYLTKNKVKTAGDLLTVLSDEELIKMVGLELKRTLSPQEKSFEQDYAEIQAQKVADAKGAEAAAARSPATASGDDDGKKKEQQAKREAVAWENVDLTKYIEMKPGDPIMAEVVDRYPNGNYKVKGTKKVRFRNQLRLLSFVGIAKHSDVSDDDTVPAGKLYEYRLEALR